MIEKTSLRYFREVALQGSLRHAAERLYVAQSALSRQIGVLERELGVTLFERSARGMVLTPAGRLFLQYVDESRARLRAVRAAIHEFELLERGHVELASVEGVLATLVPEFAEDFLAQHPGITLNVSMLGSHAVAESVAEHRADLGVVFGQPPRSDLLELAALSTPLCAIVAPHHSLARLRQCRLADVTAWRLVLPDPSFGIRQLVDRVASAARLELAVVIEANTLLLAQRMVMHTDYVTFLPRDCVRTEIGAGRLVAVPLEEPLLKQTRSTLVASASRKLSPAAQRAAELLTERMVPRSGGAVVRGGDPGCAVLAGSSVL